MLMLSLGAIDAVEVAVSLIMNETRIMASSAINQEKIHQDANSTISLPTTRNSGGLMYISDAFEIESTPVHCVPEHSKPKAAGSNVCANVRDRQPLRNLLGHVLRLVRSAASNLVLLPKRGPDAPDNVFTILVGVHGEFVGSRKAIYREGFGDYVPHPGRSDAIRDDVVALVNTNEERLARLAVQCPHPSSSAG